MAKGQAKDVVSNQYNWKQAAAGPPTQAAAPAEAPGKGAAPSTPVRSIRVERADNGVTVECNHEAPKTKKGEGLADYESLTRRYVFQSPKEAAAFIAEKL